MKENYQLLLDNIIKENEKNNYAPTLLLHSCCGPCSSYCLEYLSNYFIIILIFILKKSIFLELKNREN